MTSARILTLIRSGGGDSRVKIGDMTANFPKISYKKECISLTSQNRGGKFASPEQIRLVVENSEQG